ncbi:MAG TPA: Ig-like domain-containing protein [Acidobacteriota bacterium]|nr:Ig-like domain-containing protein [Acidobacteriota bacterium]
MSAHVKLRFWTLWFLISLALFAGSAQAQPGIKPKVSLTDPANGATNVSRFKDCITVTFDSAMDTSASG